MFMMIFSR